MDKSIRLTLLDPVAFLLGDEVVTLPRDEMTAERWVELVLRVIQLCRPHLKYMPEFRPMLSNVLVQYGEDEDKTEFPEGSGNCPKTELCRYNTRLGGYTLDNRRECSIYLSRKGKLICLDTLWSNYPSLVSWEARFVEAEELLQLCAAGNGKRILSGLSGMLEDGINARKRQIEAWSEIETKIDGILPKIG